jgi:hypothetical protein
MAVCTNAGLVVWLDTQAQGALGTTVYRIELTNLTGTRCSLTGYLSVSAFELSGKRVGTPASRYRLSVKTVELKPRSSAYALLFVREPGTFQARCGPRTAAGLRVMLPHGDMVNSIPFPLPACSTPQPFLSVGPISG